jgi:NAD(P)-dependent dehydrogenase (short-subunit alcohol dehydrogenase family)
LLPYSASKFALVGLSEGLRMELAKDGILVTTVCPGLMRTGSPEHLVLALCFAAFVLGDSAQVFSLRTYLPMRPATAKAPIQRT